MLSVAKTMLEIRRSNDPEQVAVCGQTIPDHSAPCGGCASERAACKGAQQKE
jgi:hypothetical protein